MYLARRRLDDIWRDYPKSISEAVRDGSAAWGLDEEALFKIRSEKVDGVGVIVRETGDVFLTPAPLFVAQSSARPKGRANQRYLPFSLFKSRVAVVKA